MTKHTPGPWMTHAQYVITGNPEGPINALNREDACVIAEAPAMLTALKAYLDLFNELASRDGQMAGGIAWYQMADDLAELIAKAEGQP